MITARRYRDGVATGGSIELTAIADALASEDTFLWVDAEDPTDEDLQALERGFGLHPLEVEDVKHRHQRAKVELYQEHAFVVLRPVRLGDDDELIEHEVHAFVGRRFIVTLRPAPAYDLTEVVSRWERQPDLFREGGGFAIYALIDEVVDDYLTAVERFEDLADDLEDLTFAADDSDEGTAVQERIFKLKREIVRLRRFAMPVRQGLDLLQERPDVATPSLGPYFRDATDHVIRVVELADNIRDLLTSLMEVRVAQVASRLNLIMKKLTSWAAIILIPTLIAGIYGMNFRDMPELRWPFGYWLALGAMALSALVLYRVFKRKDWL